MATIRADGRTPDRINLMFRAFSDRTRLRILRLLQDAEMCVGDLLAVLGVPQPTASRHLAYLRKAGLVTTRREGTWVYYALTPAKSRFHRQLLGCIQNCLGEVPELDRDARQARKIRQAGGCCPRLGPRRLGERQKLPNQNPHYHDSAGGRNAGGFGRSS